MNLQCTKSVIEALRGKALCPGKHSKEVAGWGRGFTPIPLKESVSRDVVSLLHELDMMVKAVRPSLPGGCPD